MIPKITSTWDSPDWQIELGKAINSPQALIDALDLPAGMLEELENAHRLFPIRVPRPYLARIRRGDPEDPLLKQIIGTSAELDLAKGFHTDPLAEEVSTPRSGILHKYHGRALIVTTGACAIHCRYCFRRHFDYQDNNPLGSQWHETLDYLRQDTSLFEVILSGGDPLSLSDRKLGKLIESLGQIPHLKYLRLHTRQPIVIPARVTGDLIKILSRKRFKTTMVLHINHPRELDQQTAESLGALSAAGIQLLNQSVLLKGINDNVDTLGELSHTLYQANILPYYLHTLDRVQGAAHFAIDDSLAQQLHRALQARLPGYLVPRLVREIAGEPGKTPL